MPLSFLKKPFVRKMSSAMFTQGMLSVTNFIVGFAIAKYATKNEYGLYVILFSIIGIAGNFQNALVNDPMTVLLPKKNAEEKHSFLSGLGYGQWLFFIPLVALTLIVVSIYSFLNKDFSLLKYISVLSIATLTYLLREYFRTVSYTKMQIHLIVKMDVLFMAFMAAGICALILLDRVTGSSSIAMLGIGYFVAAVFEYVCAGEVYNAKIDSIRNSFRETWQYSKWALVGVTSDIFKNRGYIYIVTVSVGLAETADISAARLFLMPIGLLVASSAKFILAKGADVFHVEGSARFRKIVMTIIAASIAAWAVYVISLTSVMEYLTSFLGEKYGNIQGHILLWGIYFLVYSIRYQLTNALTVCREFKALANYSVISGIVTVGSCLVLTATHGGIGTIMSLIAGELVMLAFAYIRLSASLATVKAT